MYWPLNRMLTLMLTQKLIIFIGFGWVYSVKESWVIFEYIIVAGLSMFDYVMWYHVWLG